LGELPECGSAPLAGYGVQLQTALGLEVDSPAGTVRVNPARPAPFGALEVTGLVAGGGSLSIRTSGDGTVLQAEADGLRVQLG